MSRMNLSLVRMDMRPYLVECSLLRAV